MKRQILAAAITGLMAFGGTAALSAADPGPNGSNDHGLCTAFFNGQKNGHEKQKDRNGEYPGPFQALVVAAEESHPNNNDDDPDNDVEGADAVYWYCALQDGAPGISGNPDDNGRWTCEEDTSGNEDHCTENEPKSNGR